MTVKRLIEILNKVVDPDRADIEIWCDSQEYELDSVGQFSIIPTVTFSIKQIESSIMKPITNFRRDKEKMVKKTIKKIKKDGKTRYNFNKTI